MKSVEQIIAETNGKTFHVAFRKADGTLREMDCRTGVSKHTKGGVATYNGKGDNKGNIGVWEAKRNDKGQWSDGAYKCFNKDRVVSIRFQGKQVDFQ